MAQKPVGKMKRIFVGLPDETLAGIDDLVSETNASRSLVIRTACHFYIEEKRRDKLREKMKAGYQEMAEINRMLAEEMASDFVEPPLSAQADEESSSEMSSEASSETQPRWRHS